MSRRATAPKERDEGHGQLRAAVVAMFRRESPSPGYAGYGELRWPTVAWATLQSDRALRVNAPNPDGDRQSIIRVLGLFPLLRALGPLALSAFSQLSKTH